MGGETAITNSYRLALVIAAAVAGAAAPLTFFGLSGRVRADRTARRVHCAVDGAPLQPSPAAQPSHQ